MTESEVKKLEIDYWACTRGEQSRRIYRQAPAKTMKRNYPAFHTAAYHGMPAKRIDRCRLVQGKLSWDAKNENSVSR